MKQLLLIRHAKSDWGNPGLADFDRPLNERGKKNAPEMAQRLLDKKIIIDTFVASPAKRAAKTAKYFTEVYNLSKNEIIFKEELYMAATSHFLQVISNLSDKDNSVAIFSHNNGITDFANQLTTARIDNIPTCGIFAIKINCKSWADFEKTEKEFWFFDYPKLVDND